MLFDVLIIGGGVSGMSCALVLGSAKNKAFVTDKKIGIFTYQKILHYKKLFSTTLTE
jgi:thioredoxin reductase